MAARQFGAGIAIVGIALGAFLGTSSIAQAAKVPAGTFVLRSGYYNETPDSTGVRESCDFYAAEANKYLTNGDTRSAAQLVNEVNAVKGCTIVYRSYSFAEASRL